MLPMEPESKKHDFKSTAVLAGKELPCTEQSASQ